MNQTDLPTKLFVLFCWMCLVAATLFAYRKTGIALSSPRLLKALATPSAWTQTAPPAVRPHTSHSCRARIPIELPHQRRVHGPIIVQQLPSTSQASTAPHAFTATTKAQQQAAPVVGLQQQPPRSQRRDIIGPERFILKPSTLTSTLRSLITMKRITCTTCDRDLPVNQFPTHPDTCDHPRETCKRRWHQWLASQLKSQQVDKIACAQCATVLDQRAFRTLAIPTVYEKYLDASLRIAVSADESFRYCINPSGCKSGQMHDINYNIFRCFACSHKACSQCNVAWHEGESCEAYQENMSVRHTEERASEEAVKKLSKLCPNAKCNKKIEKDGGCDHMTCEFSTAHLDRSP